MARHVFEIGRTGYVWHRGEYVAETNRMFKVRNGPLRTRLVRKDGNLVIECDDPKDAVKKGDLARDIYRAEQSSAQSEINKLTDRIREIERIRYAAVIAALTGEAS